MTRIVRRLRGWIDRLRTPTPAEVFERLLLVFSARGYTYTAQHETLELSIDFRNASGEWRTLVRYARHQDAVLVLSSPKATVAAARRIRVAAELTAINAPLVCGNWELIPSSGVLYFRTSLMLRGGAASDRLLWNVVDANLEGLQATFDAVLAAVELGGSTPAGDASREERSLLH